MHRYEEELNKLRKDPENASNAVLDSLSTTIAPSSPTLGSSVALNMSSPGNQPPQPPNIGAGLLQSQLGNPTSLPASFPLTSGLDRSSLSLIKSNAYSIPDFLAYNGTNPLNNKSSGLAEIHSGSKRSHPGDPQGK